MVWGIETVEVLVYNCQRVVLQISHWQKRTSVVVILTPGFVMVLNTRQQCSSCEWRVGSAQKCGLIAHSLH